MDYTNSTLSELRVLAKKQRIKSIEKLKKEDLIKILKEVEINKIEKSEKEYKEIGNTEISEGILEVLPDGFGFLRKCNYLSISSDVYVSPSQIRKFNLKTGDKIKGSIKIETENEKFPALIYIISINGDLPELVKDRKIFEKLKPIYPQEKFKLNTTSNNIGSRLIDIISPIGKGQRGLIVAPPKTGKTTLLKELANNLIKNNKDIYLIVLLIDERPEEVTDIERSIIGNNVEVIASTFDEQPENHRKIAEMVLERGKRLAEQGKNPIILLDSITRLARAYNIITPSSGKTLSGGLDPATLYMPKKFFGAARNIENGGSLTIIATALIETGSKMDDIIFEEFKGTGNMELVLDKRLAERRIFPAIDITKSGTRKEEYLLEKEYLEISYYLRKLLSNSNQNIEITEKIIEYLKDTKTNDEFIKIIKKLEI